MKKRPRIPGARLPTNHGYDRLRIYRTRHGFNWCVLTKGDIVLCSGRTRPRFSQAKAEAGRAWGILRAAAAAYGWKVA